MLLTSSAPILHFRHNPARPNHIKELVLLDGSYENTNQHHEGIESSKTDAPSLARPRTLSFFFPFFVFASFITGAGSVGLPLPLAALVSSAATVADACDCCMTLNSLTTDKNGL